VTLYGMAVDGALIEWRRDTGLGLAGWERIVCMKPFIGSQRMG
jgi:hypothetical protein